MDWVFRAWDWTELDFDHTSLMENNQSMEVFSVGPTSGISGDGTINKWNDQKRSTISPTPHSSKKQRGHTSEQQVSCLVDGCTANLTSCRDYHRRHRVCETHSKTPVVTVGGKDQRFCQQCSRFHSLGEFDEVKRSCRKRLDGHNRRRRKPRAGSMYLNYGSFLTNHQGTKLLRFGGSPSYTTTTSLGSPLRWPNDEKFKQQLHVSVEQSTASNSYARFCSVREKRFPFLLSDEGIVDNTNASAYLVGEFSERLTQLVEPKGALSLLSKHTIHTSESSPSNLVQPSGTILQLNDPHIPLRGVSSDHLVGMIHMRSEGLLENEAAQVVSFSWK